MATTTTFHITLDSQDGVPTPERGVLRFTMDSVLRNISNIEWVTLEVQENHALTIDDKSDTLYFSEELRCFKATLPHGAYTCASLHAAIETAMCCATDVVDALNEGPRNAYSVRVLQDSSRLCISSDGSVPFALHNFQDILKIRSLRRLGPFEAQVTVLYHDSEPFARGNILHIFRPGTAPIHIQVLHAVTNVVLVRLLAKSPSSDFDRDINSEHEGWTLQAVCHGTTLPDLLGLGPKDLRSNSPIPVVQSSSPLLGNTGTAVDTKTMHLGVTCPHGCLEGDVVLLDGFEAPFLNGQLARVSKVVSEQQILVDIDARQLVTFPRDQVLRFLVEGDPCTIHVHHATVLQAQENSVVLKVSTHNSLMSAEKSPRRAKGKWLATKVMPPVPCKEWTKGDIEILQVGDEAGASFLIRWPYRHVPSPEACIQRNAIVGVKKMNLLHKKSVLLMRLRVGTTEAYGITALNGSNNIRVFGRAQMKQSGFLAKGDHSLVGRTSFQPPLERTSFLDVCFLTPQNHVVHPNVLGDYSLLLQVQAST